MFKELNHPVLHLSLASFVASFSSGSTDLQLRVLSVSSFLCRSNSDNSLMDGGLNRIVLGNV